MHDLRKHTYHYIMDIHETEKQRETRETARQLQHDIDAANFRLLVGSEIGRPFIRELIAQCGVYRTTFTGDSQTTAFNEGARSIGLWVLDKFNECPDLYIALIKENNDLIN